MVLILIVTEFTKSTQIILFQVLKQFGDLS